MEVVIERFQFSDKGPARKNLVWQSALNPGTIFAGRAGGRTFLSPGITCLARPGPIPWAAVVRHPGTCLSPKTTGGGHYGALQTIPLAHRVGDRLGGRSDSRRVLAPYPPLRRGHRPRRHLRHGHRPGRHATSRPCTSSISSPATSPAVVLGKQPNTWTGYFHANVSADLGVDPQRNPKYHDGHGRGRSAARRGQPPAAQQRDVLRGGSHQRQGRGLRHALVALDVCRRPVAERAAGHGGRHPLPPSHAARAPPPFPAPRNPAGEGRTEANRRPARWRHSRSVRTSSPSTAPRATMQVTINGQPRQVADGTTSPNCSTNCDWPASRWRSKSISNWSPGSATPNTGWPRATAWKSSPWWAEDSIVAGAAVELPLQRSR